MLRTLTFYTLASALILAVAVYSISALLGQTDTLVSLVYRGIYLVTRE